MFSRTEKPPHPLPLPCSSHNNLFSLVHGEQTFVCIVLFYFFDHGICFTLVRAAVELEPIPGKLGVRWGWHGLDAQNIMPTHINTLN